MTPKETNAADLPRQLLDILVCPQDRARVRPEGTRLVCVECGRAYPVRDGIPIMLVDEAEMPQGAAGQP